VGDVSSLNEHRFLVTGAYGCIGAWVLRDLLAKGAGAVAADLADSSPRLGLVLDDEHDERLVRVRLDVTDLAALERVIDEQGITRVIHLAALQVPFCRADPPLGAAVNVVGTVNVLEAARRWRDRIPHVVYASSIAVYGAPDGDPARSDDGDPARSDDGDPARSDDGDPARSDDGDPARSDDGVPGTLYGVYKRAGELAAARYWLDDQLPSIGLRPHTVFGPARDQGLTSAPTMAMLAAAAQRPYKIPFGGAAQFQYAPDVATAFVQAALADAESAAVHNLRGVVCSIAELVEMIVEACPHAAGSISFDETPLPFPAQVDSDGLEDAIGVLNETPLPAAVRDTVERFRVALSADRIDPAILQ
jgi:nucleoside-diphosphate-sugar epimerase